MIKITSDSTCDLSSELQQKLNISLVPLHILVDDKDYRDGVDITAQDIFKYVGEEGKTCKTAAVNVFEYETFFEQYTKDYEAVIHLCLGSKFSSCYQNAKIASASFDNVYVIDTENLTMGSGLLLMEAAQLVSEGLTAQKIVEQLEQSKHNVNCSFVIDKLDYLHKGGRCSGVEALGASLLKIKPSIEVVDSVLKVGKKYRGSFSRCVENYIKDRLTLSSNIDYTRVALVHSACSPEQVEMAVSLIKELSSFKEIAISSAGCTISSHCGPNTLGIVYKTK